MKPNKKELAKKLLKGIESGNPESVKVVTEKRYIQHNPQLRKEARG